MLKESDKINFFMGGAMLRNPVSEVAADSIPDDFEKLYRIIASDSYNKSCPLVSALGLIREKLFDYVNSVFSDDKKLTAIDLKILVARLDMLLKRNFFEDKFAVDVLQIIKQDILDNGRILTAKILGDKREEFILRLGRINEACEASVPSVNVIPDEIKAGLAKTEQRTITAKKVDFHSKPGANLCDRGLQHFKKYEWVAAAALFNQAIIAECEMAAETKQPVNEINIRTYQRNIAYSFNWYGLDFFEIDRYAEAIENFKKAIGMLQSIKADYLEEKDRTVLAMYHRSLARALNRFAIQSFHAGKLDQAIFNHNEAILTLNMIQADLLTDEDSETYVGYQRNFAYVLSQQGHVFFYQNEFDKAITCYGAVLEVVNQIKPEWIEQVDLEYKKKNEYHLALTKAAKDRTLAGNNPSAFFNGKPETEEPDQVVDSKKRKREEARLSPK